MEEECLKEQGQKPMAQEEKKNEHRYTKTLDRRLAKVTKFLG